MHILLALLPLTPLLFYCGCNKPRIGTSRMTRSASRTATTAATADTSMTFTKIAFKAAPAQPVALPEEMAHYNGGRTTLPQKKVVVVRRALADWLRENRSDLF